MSKKYDVDDDFLLFYIFVALYLIFMGYGWELLGYVGTVVVICVGIYSITNSVKKNLLEKRNSGRSFLLYGSLYQ